MAILLLPLLAVGACSSDDTYLPALLADPMAEYSHPDLEVDFRTEIPQGEGRVGGFASLASVTTGFVLQGDADSVIADVLTNRECRVDRSFSGACGGIRWDKGLVRREGTTGRVGGPRCQSQSSRL